MESRIENEAPRIILTYMAAGNTAEATTRNQNIEEEVEKKNQIIK